MTLEATITPGGAPGERGDLWTGEPVTDPCIVTDPFGIPRGNTLGYHTGIDLAPIDPLRPPILFAWEPGEVTWVGEWEGATRTGPSATGGYGNVVEVTFARRRSRFAHLKAFGPKIAEWIRSGKPVRRRPLLHEGDAIGVMGNTGNVRSGGIVPALDDKVSGTHVHFELQVPIAGGWQFVNPYRYVRAPEEVDAGTEPIVDASPALLKALALAALTERLKNETDLAGAKAVDMAADDLVRLLRSGG